MDKQKANGFCVSIEIVSCSRLSIYVNNADKRVSLKLFF
jgi:hypothetical protein